MKKTLWTKDFSLISVATILSVIGGEAMNLPLSLLVFDETQSTFLSAILLICGMLPDIVLPVLIAPIIDKSRKKRWIVCLDLLLVFVYLLMGFWIFSHPFQYSLYLAFTLVVGTISVCYSLAYQAWYPSLMTKGMEQKGYAVSSTIYPTVIIVMAPIATFLYENIEMYQIFILVAGLTFASVLLESNIKDTKVISEEKYTLSEYFADIKDGFSYIMQEKGIRNIYTYMSITNGASNGIGTLTQAFYQTQSWLTVTMLGFLKSAEMIGRMLGGILQYRKEIPAKKRYVFTKFVYTVYDLLDAFLLFMPYPFMVVNRFVCGSLGVSSATIRQAAVQSYLPDGMRARVSAFFSVVTAMGGILFQLVAGVMGEVMPYRVAALILGLLTFLSMIVFIVLPGKVNASVYNYEG